MREAYTDGVAQRSFFWLAVEGSAHAELARLVDGWRVRYGNVRWLPPEKFGLTVFFLGDRERAAVRALIERVRQSIVGMAPFVIAFSRVMFFPTERGPRVVTIACEGGAPLRTFHRRLATLVGSTPLPVRPFRPHVTVGRVAERGGDWRVMAQASVVGSWTVDTVSLMESHLGPSGSTYACLKRIPFSIR